MTNLNIISFQTTLKLLLILLLFQSCQSDKAATKSYSFFVAGHTYGNPMAKNKGLYPAFTDKFSELQQHENLKFGVLTGDIVRSSNEKSWETVWKELNPLNIKIHIAAGNHDIKNKQLFKKYVHESYYAFQQSGDLFIVLNPNIDQWNIAGKQLDFLKNELSKAENYRHIFVFCHQLIWWQSDKKWGTCQPNSFENMSENLNFQSEVLPLFENVKNQVLLIAGDVGAVPNSSAICYLKKENVSFIASGMGVGKKDNFLLIDVDKNGEIAIELIGLRGENLGDLEDYLNEI
jgi:hypothetical protein